MQERENMADGNDCSLITSYQYAKVLENRMLTGYNVFTSQYKVPLKSAHGGVLR